MALTADDVRKVAFLSRLELEEWEVESQRCHINALVERFEALRALDTSGIEPASHGVPLFNVLRDDVCEPSLSRDEATSNAPLARDGFFIVPRIVEG